MARVTPVAVVWRLPCASRRDATHEPALQLQQRLDFINQFLVSPSEFLPVGDCAGSDGLGIAVEDALNRKSVRARPATYPAVLEVIQENLTKQVAGRRAF